MDNDNDYVNLGRQLQLARKKIGISQTEAGNILGIAQSRYALYEMGKRKMPINLIKLFSEKFNVSMDILLGVRREENKFPELTEKYDFLDEKGKHTVDTVLRMEYERCGVIAAHSDREEDTELIREDIAELKKRK